MLLVGVTPPRGAVTPAEATRIGEVLTARLAGLDLDALVLYDIDDESDRNPSQRPFPYLPTMDPAAFHRDHLAGWDRPVIIYRCVGKYRQAELTDWLQQIDTARVSSVFVGSSSSAKPVHTTLGEAQELRERLRPDLPLGAVMITERLGEDARMLAKQQRGASFFISQIVYDVAATKQLMTDYHAATDDPRPVIFTLSVCGSLKTLEFLHWLGVQVPPSVEHTLRTCADPLAESYAQCLANAHELAAFCRAEGMAFGFNVESVSIRKTEIDASVRLARALRDRGLS